MRTVSGFSIHPDPATAVGEAVSDVIDQQSQKVDAALVVVSFPHAHALALIVAATSALLETATVLGVVVEACAGNTAQPQRGPAVVVHAFMNVDASIHVVDDDLDATTFGHYPLNEHDFVLVLLPGNGSALLPLAQRLEAMSMPATVLAGCMGDGPPGAPTVCVRNMAMTDTGAAFVLRNVDAVVTSAFGAIPVGVPLAVTEVDEARLVSLAGAPAMKRLAETAEMVAAAAGGVQPELTLAMVDGNPRDRINDNDFTPLMIRSQSILDGWIEVDRRVEVGDLVQFHAVAPGAGSDRLVRTLAPYVHSASGALVLSGQSPGAREVIGSESSAADFGESLPRSVGVTTILTTAELVRSAGRNVMGRTTTAVALLGEGSRSDD